MKERELNNIIEVDLETGKIIKQAPLQISEECIKKSGELLAKILLNFAKENNGKKMTPRNVFGTRRVNEK